jgi:hypothetical protein
VPKDVVDVKSAKAKKGKKKLKSSLLFLNNVCRYGRKINGTYEWKI